MRTKQQATLDIERVVHGSRRMILRLIERGEVMPIGFYFRAIGDVESHRTENRFEALPGADDRMDPAATATAPGKRYIERILRQSDFQRKHFDRLAARLQQ